MTVAIFMYESTVPITGCRIVIRNFIPGTLQGKKISLQTTRYVCILLYPYLQTALSKPFSHSGLPGSCLPRKTFLFFS